MARLQDRDQLFHERPDDILVNQQGFHGIAGRRTGYFGIFNDTDSHIEIGIFINIDMADTATRFDDRYLSRIDDHADQAGSPAGNSQIDILAQCQEFADQGPVGIFHDGNGIGRQSGSGNGMADDPGKSYVGTDGFTSAAQYRGVARLQAQDGSIDGDIGAGFKDDGDDAKRDRDLIDVKTVGPVPGRQGLSNRIWQGNDLTDSFCHSLNPVLCQGQPVNHGIAHPLFPGGSYIGRIGVHNIAGMSQQIISNIAESLVLYGCIGIGQSIRCLPGCPGLSDGF